MLPTVLLALAFSLMLIEVPIMRRRGLNGELVAFGVVWALALTLGLLVAWGVPTNQLHAALRGVFEPIAKTFLVPPPT